MSARGVARLAPGKVNLALHVTGRREDGYHLLDSIAVFADIGDRVEIAAADEISLNVTGPFAAHAPGGPADLAWRAASAFFDHTGLAAAASIRVEKNIPAGAGLGGGSADAAAVLLGLNELFDTQVPDEELAELGLRLGADVPMCLAGKALRARGVGEEIVPLDGWPSLPMVLIWPGVSVSTAEVFRTMTRRDNPPLPDPPGGTSPTALVNWLQNTRNDLEPPALRIAPAVREALDALRATEGCLLARMSGSGSGCFGLYADREAADRAAAEIGRREPAWWSVATEAR
jgi:4-diphosphocytidyl-2-C-methyl-D-erythritol kinase